MKTRTFVIGDIHGGLKSLEQCLERSKFNFSKDELICLGDVADGLPETAQCIELLMRCKKLVYIWGNHDIWLYKWLTKKETPEVWTIQGGVESIFSYLKEGEKSSIDEVEKRHAAFFRNNARGLYIDSENRCFVHGGIPEVDTGYYGELKELTWSRRLVDRRIEKIDYHKEVFVGHTSIYRWSDKPIWNGNICLMDTGGGYEGKLSMMNVETREVFQSDKVRDLYPNADIYNR